MPLPDRYSSFDFDPYKFQEYPKQVTHNGVAHVVLSAEEERGLLSLPVVDSRAELLKKAEKLGVMVSDKWKTETIAEVVRTAESEADAVIIKSGNPLMADSEKTDLLAKAERLGIAVDKRWGESKLRAAIEQTE